MKPLLRAVLIIDAVLLLAFGVLFVLTPWQALFNALQLANVQPAMLGQAFGIALLGLAWLAFHAAINGDLTAPVARAVGHVNWLTGVLTIVWSIGTGNGPALAAAGRVLSAIAGVALIVLGLGGVRLASAVRRREKAQALDARAPATPAGEPAMPAAAPQRVEPVVSRPVAPVAPSSPAASTASGRSSGTVALDERPPMQD
ncbi:hypothetical protein WS58_03325 [Burkholderia pseudomultivorans]|uniref:Transmembrane protein n=1 Tax=Burkholderia pseudomultivorans TaxID=1207504 RepID=A0A132ES37_9BURK|nr:hypothetical protein [Burkholderia pseudomultivorans]AOI92613.1 hypothetical protein WS57_28500 [Burkholderia pseudomultivorans]KVC35748.1 hypothetical protein WS56_08835 [Burkholderia pseudomultivorans]KVC38658.1 hypothetical protein WS55_27820 [Burkholderia pseudomultivorans]KVC52566.1 hypothetical protein WS58_03325 [Burkholderia pseudomultivorans]KVG63771.1 hypothetical protein WS80_20285 [Burkholderia pseudomultivorans]